MVDLYHHDQPHFTRWVIENGLLKEPLVVVDVGVQGGEHPRWSFLGDMVRVYGFDAMSEGIERLVADRKPNRFYRTLAIGNEDGERELHVAGNPFGTSFFEAPDTTSRIVPIAKLDTLYAAGELPTADVIKIDCEGFEGETMRGARRYIALSNVLCVTAETSFEISRIFPRTQFADIQDATLDHRLSLFDVNLVRYPRDAYQRELKQKPWPKPDPMSEVPRLDVGQPSTADVLLCRDFTLEAKSPEAFTTIDGAVVAPTVDKIIKMMIIFELHGLMDCSVELADYFKPMLADRMDTTVAIAHLMQPPPHARNTKDVVNCLRMIAELRLRGG